jgi:adenylylsulfate kinase-like enzyme
VGFTSIEGKVEKFTGISSPYEEPEDPEILITSYKLRIEESADLIIKYLISNKYIRKDGRKLSFTTSFEPLLQHL